MARYDNDILLYDAHNKPLVTKSGIYFSPFSYGNVGKYRPTIQTQLKNTEESVNMNDRRQVVAISRQLTAQMAEVESACRQKADLAVGLGMEPVYLGENEEWAE